MEKIIALDADKSLLQLAIDGLTAEMRRKRSDTQMTLGELIARLKQFPPEAEITNLAFPHSYRGYYSDLAFEHVAGTRPAFELLLECEESLGAPFEGYKGGEYEMGKTTPIWVACWGSTGSKLLAVCDDGTIETAEDTYD